MFQFIDIHAFHSIFLWIYWIPMAAPSIFNSIISIFILPFGQHYTIYNHNEWCCQFLSMSSCKILRYALSLKCSKSIYWNGQRSMLIEKWNHRNNICILINLSSFFIFFFGFHWFDVWMKKYQKYICHCQIELCLLWWFHCLSLNWSRFET